MAPIDMASTVYLGFTMIEKNLNYCYLRSQLIMEKY